MTSTSTPFLGQFLGHVEGLVLQKENGVLQADGRGQEALRVGRGRGKSNLEAGRVPEDGLDVLGVAEAPMNVAPAGHAHHHRAAPVPVRPVAEGGHLVAKLLHRGPDVVGNLDLDDRRRSLRREEGKASLKGRLLDRRPVFIGTRAVGRNQTLREREQEYAQ